MFLRPILYLFVTEMCDQLMSFNELIKLKLFMFHEICLDIFVMFSSNFCFLNQISRRRSINDCSTQLIFWRITHFCFERLLCFSQSMQPLGYINWKKSQKDLYFFFLNQYCWQIIFWRGERNNNILPRFRFKVQFPCV